MNNAEEAAAAVRAVRYPPHGMRSYGPMRSALRIGPTPAEADATVLCLAMFETPKGLANVKDICAVPGIDGAYIGPSDLPGRGTQVPERPRRGGGVQRRAGGHPRGGPGAGVIAAVHTASGDIARQRIAEGFTFVTVASDLTHLKATAANHLSTARGAVQNG